MLFRLSANGALRKKAGNKVREREARKETAAVAVPVGFVPGVDD